MASVGRPRVLVRTRQPGRVGLGGHYNRSPSPTRGKDPGNPHLP